MSFTDEPQLAITSIDEERTATEITHSFDCRQGKPLTKGRPKNNLTKLSLNELVNYPLCKLTKFVNQSIAHNLDTSTVSLTMPKQPIQRSSRLAKTIGAALFD